MNFFDHQLEKEKIIQEKLAKENLPQIKPSPKVDMSLEEKEKELELRKNQLEYIFKLVKEQEQTKPEIGFEILCPHAKNHLNNDYTFSVLKEDGTYEQKELELKNIFESQLKLYGL